MTYPPVSAFWSNRRPFRYGAFTLMELLAVIAVMGIMAVIIAPSLVGISKSGDLNKAGYEVAGILQVARTYAVANNTYVWVGFFEEDISKTDAAPAKPGIGRLVVCAVASKDGTPIYNPEIAMSASPTTQPLSQSSLVAIAKPLKLDNIHVVTAPSSKPSTSAFENRPGSRLSFPDRNRIGVSTSVPLFSFTYPLVGAAQYHFGMAGHTTANGIVQYSPQGEVISESGPVPGVAPCSEIEIQSTHGTVPDKGPDLVAIDLAGMTGQAKIYRP